MHNRIPGLMLRKFLAFMCHLKRIQLKNLNVEKLLKLMSAEIGQTQNSSTVTTEFTAITAASVISVRDVSVSQLTTSHTR